MAELQAAPGCKRLFIKIGIVIAALLSGVYLYLNYQGRSVFGGAAIPDPVWTRFVNVSLIFFVVILQASLLGRFCNWLLSRKRKD